jgi:hypothetical protein
MPSNGRSVAVDLVVANQEFRGPFPLVSPGRCVESIDLFQEELFEYTPDLWNIVDRQEEPSLNAPQNLCKPAEILPLEDPWSV